jgi:tRNA(adenine34) deaminase
VVTIMKEDERYMQVALEEAGLAFDLGEVPVGAVIVRDGKIISRAHNSNRSFKNAILHAEIIAIQGASEVLGNERLVNCDLYVTKEPCAMCAGAIIHSRIRNVYIGVADFKAGACGTVLTVCGSEKMNHLPHIEFGLLGDDAGKILQDFFKGLRDKNGR